MLDRVTGTGRQTSGPRALRGKQGGYWKHKPLICCLSHISFGRRWAFWRKAVISLAAMLIPSVRKVLTVC